MHLLRARETKISAILTLLRTGRGRPIRDLAIKTFVMAVVPSTPLPPQDEASGLAMAHTDAVIFC